MDTCYFKHGFPPGSRSGRSTPTANDATAENTPPQTPIVDNHNSPAPSVNITEEDYKHLLTLLQNSKAEASTSQTNAPPPVPHDAKGKHVISHITQGGNSFTYPINWILDTGSTIHICPYQYLFFDYYSIDPISINLPNGNRILATNSGTVPINKSIILENVLHFPDFKFYLISVQVLTKSLSCQLTFTPFQCLIQDLHSMKMIGAAKAPDGLYILPHSHDFSVLSVNSAHNKVNISDPTSYPTLRFGT